MGAWNLAILVEDSNIGGPNSHITVSEAKHTGTNGEGRKLLTPK